MTVEIGKRARAARSVVSEILAYGKGMIVRIQTDKNPFEVLERLEEVLVELRAFISSSPRARGEKRP